MLTKDNVDTPLSPLPRNWDLVKLKDATLFEKISLDPQKFPDEEFEYYSIPAYAEHGEPVIEFGRNIHSQKLMVDKGTILFGKLNPRVPKVWHVVSDTHRRKIASTEFIPLRHREGVSDDKYIYNLAWSEYLLPKSQELVSGSTPSRQRVDTSALLNILVPLPPLPEQRAIAHVLTTVRQAIEATERVIEAARQLKKSMMKHLFTYGPVAIDQVGLLALKETEIGHIPTNWDMRRFGDVVTTTGRTIDPKEEKDLPYVGLEHIISGDNRIRSYGNPTSVKSAKTLFNPHNILYGKLRPYLDKAALADRKGMCSTDILVFQVYNNIDPYFIVYLLHIQKFIDYSISTTAGVNHPRTSWNSIQKYQFAIPPLSVQRKISKILLSIDRKISSEEDRLIALTTLFRSLLHNLMTGKVRVQVEQ